MSVIEPRLSPIYIRQRDAGPPQVDDAILVDQPNVTGRDRVSRHRRYENLQGCHGFNPVG